MFVCVGYCESYAEDLSSHGHLRVFLDREQRLWRVSPSVARDRSSHILCLTRVNGKALQIAIETFLNEKQ